MSLTRKASTVGKRRPKPPRQDLAATLAECEAELAEARREQAATAEILRVVSRSKTNAAPVFEAILEACRRLFGSDEIGVYTIGDDEMVRVAAWLGPRAEEVRRDVTPVAESVTGRIIRERRIHHIPDLRAEPNLSLAVRQRVERLGSATLLYAPMLWEDRGLGSILVARSPPRPFSEREQTLLQTFADQAVIAIENVRLFDEVQARTRDLSQALEQQTATAEVLKVISRSAFDLNLATSTILEAAARLCRAPLATLHLRDGEVCRLATQFGLPEAFERQAREDPIPVRYPLHSRRPARAGVVAHFPDAWNDPDYLYKTTAKLGGYRAIVVIPLMRDDELVGIFSLGRPEPEPFTPSQIKLVQTFADQAAIAIENARLFNEVKARTDDLGEALQQQTATAEVLKVISRSAFDLDAIFQTLATTAADLCNASSGTLCVRDGEVFRYRGQAGRESSPELQKYLEDHPLRSPGPETAAGRAILSRQIAQIPDILLNSSYAVPLAAHGNPARAVLAVPLLGKSRVEGAFVLTRAEPGPYTARQIEILRTFADQAVIAIENARLFDEVEARTKELAASLDDLRKAQDRLIQSEKLASLGQLTAGIAHEIKNPLNFINNFSALSRELVGELADTIKAAPLDDARRKEAEELIGTIGGNLDKVVQHGRRADSIVKNMLLHSREGSGERSMTNVNAMLEEALNLAYHGARAEKPGFNVTIAKSLDPNAGAADLYPQEITRVLLNLISNAFYATVEEKTGRPERRLRADADRLDPRSGGERRNRRSRQRNGDPR